ncbi:MAG: type II toxin-antitoxin system RelE/ParE family toxin [Clostridia bacterium]|nr:type II toxin-antitoxin system RelE/ParE family toxin [Clostridia bacterium]
MNWKLAFLPEAVKDLKNLDGSQRLLVLKSIKKVQTNPLPICEGGYGKPLGNKNGKNLSGFLKIKLRDAGIRVVYKLIKTETQMLIVVIGARADDEVYEIADKRIEKNGL